MKTNKANFSGFVIATFITISTFFSINANAQCEIDLFSSITIIDDTAKVCDGQIVLLGSTGTCGTSLMYEDFNTAALGTGWNSNCNPQFNNPCDPSPNTPADPYCWIGNTVTQPRRLTTVAYNTGVGDSVNNLCTICFDMDYATEGGISPCEGPDLSTEGVHLQYSINGGITWTDINYWDPNGGFDTVLTSWNNYCENVPINPTGPIQFSWYQDVVGVNNEGHWGVDDIAISCPALSEFVSWTGPNGFAHNGFNPPPFMVISGWYVATIIDTVGNAGADADSVYIEVMSQGILPLIITGPTLTSPTTGSAYQWLYCDSSYMPIPGATNQSITAIPGVNYAVIVVDYFGCADDTSSCFSVPTEIESINQSQNISVYPNPTNKEINITGDNIYKIEILDYKATVVKTISSNRKLITIDLDNYKKGLYIARIYTNKEIYYRKIILN